MNNLIITYPKQEYFNCLSLLFSDIVKLNEDKKFHPHAFDKDFANYLCSYSGKDLYYIIVNESDINEVVAYGFLRGWDEGYDRPCLGIYVNKKYRGQGYSKLFMNFLHLAAKNRGSKEVMLKVYKDNLTAVNLYKKIGYDIVSFDEEQYIGILKIS